MDIGWLQLSLFMLVLSVPMAIGRYFQLGLSRDMTWAVVRMTAQLILVGLYLQYLFLLDNIWVNLAWLLVMLLVGSSAIISKAKLPKRLLYLPVFSGLALGMFPVLWLMIVYLLSPEPLYTAQYLIPTAGMLLGNCLSGNIIALQRLFGAFNDRKQEYQGSLALGASPSQASLPFVQTAMQQSFAPILASMATMGLVTLPGMMTGQILGGIDPLIAIKYQLVISVAIFVTLSVSVSLTLVLSIRSTITASGRVRVSL
ncbi:ABC transporter permease [Shewanella schlegeliana]|uniref:ABC transporter permease n=1 Tax=Shewanella schlegeliana TaxID=190308 RepID=A0ABS1SZP5_9GAMM|nr:ABC transporter permease [Shewanella schlegeliana]MBL4913490.1 ABC transporter permease [Shewanella schlegeliana]MCL1108380.1 ABC transporter permease [Shewanella schlegeliana]GIU28935.1 ABC transporter permease [Shewanella schlegeliana]